MFILTIFQSSKCTFWNFKHRNYKKTYTYSGAGVNIEAGDELVEKIKSISSRTKRSGNISEIGSFGALFDVKQCGFKDPLLVSGTDGVGTKLKVSFCPLVYTVLS